MNVWLWLALLAKLYTMLLAGQTEMLRRPLGHPLERMSIWGNPPQLCQIWRFNNTIHELNRRLIHFAARESLSAGTHSKCVFAEVSARQGPRPQNYRLRPVASTIVRLSSA